MGSDELYCPNKTLCEASILKGSWDLVTRAIIRVTILIIPIRVLTTLLAKSHDPLLTEPLKKP